MITIKSDDEIKNMARACKMAGATLRRLKGLIKEGVRTSELNKAAERMIREKGGAPAFKGYRGYPASICTSINSQVVHGIPSDEVRLENGQIISIDVGVFYKGYYGDAALTIPVGDISPEAQRLLSVTEDALKIGMSAARAGNRVSDIGSAVQKFVEANGYSVVRMFVGHGIGRQLHEEPQIPNFGPPGKGARLKEGMTLAIEPMVNMGGSDVVVLEDGWTAVTTDGSLSAHFEHTVLVTSEDPVVLTTADE